MNRLNNSSMQPNSVPKNISWALPIVSVLGFADALYLTVKHYQGVAPSCIIFSGCDTVATSVYATIGPIPVALLGVIFYFFMLLLSLMYLDRRAKSALVVALLVSSVGVLFTLWFLYLQVFVIKAFCVYCIFSAITSITLFFLSLIAVRLLQQKNSPDPAV